MTVYLVCYEGLSLFCWNVQEACCNGTLFFSLILSISVSNITHIQGHIQKFLDVVNNGIYS